jgi:hypothetical protein
LQDLTTFKRDVPSHRDRIQVLNAIRSGYTGFRGIVQDNCRIKRRTGLPVELQDERLTSVAADEVLSESGVAEKDRKQYIDRIAAALILKEYMDLHQEELRN